MWRKVSEFQEFEDMLYFDSDDEMENVVALKVDGQMCVNHTPNYGIVS